MYYLNTNTPFTLFQRTRNSEIYVDKKSIDPGSVQADRDEHAVYLHHQAEALWQADLKISEIDGFQRHLNQHNVIYIDFSRQPDGCASYGDYITDIQNNIKEDIKVAYLQVGERDYSSVSQMLRATGETFLFILDEWDSIFYKAFMGKQDKTQHLEFLKGLLKDQPYVDLAYMTGVLPVAKYTSGSELNMFREYSFMNDHVYEDYFGFLEEEVRDLCQKGGSLSYEELKFWYDGYCTSGGKSLFNPRSVCFALSEGVCLNFWTETGPMGEVKAVVDASKETLEATLAGDDERVAAILEETHDREIPFLDYNDENSLSCVITLCYLAARDRYIVEREAKSGKGYCDYLFLPKKSGSPAIILELKVGGGCEAALAQIKERNYAQKTRSHGCDGVLLVGISYDKEKRHQCRIEKIQ
ncbi:MAG: AAA family ATPase [Firmicutes bacterium]|nr:AAA family ATPase [Bacillota bacterium]NBI62744.1 hypothetical protein [Clostridiales bacterium]